MTFEKPTYKEYETASSWAKFKYKYGIIVLILCWLCLLFIIYYMFTNGEAIAHNPLIYGANKYDVVCSCYNYEDPTNPRAFFVNSSTLSIP